MVAPIRQIVTVKEGGRVELTSPELTAGQEVEVIVRPKSTEDGKRGRTLSDLWGAAKGVYASPEEVDAFIRAERDAWED